MAQNNAPPHADRMSEKLQGTRGPPLDGVSESPGTLQLGTMTIDIPQAADLASQSPASYAAALREQLSPDHISVHTALERTDAYFEVYRVSETFVSSTRWVGGEWRWRFCAAGGVTIASSCGYASQNACIAAATALRQHAGAAEIFQLHD